MTTSTMTQVWKSKIGEQMKGILGMEFSSMRTFSSPDLFTRPTEDEMEKEFGSMMITFNGLKGLSITLMEHQRVL